MSFRDNFRHKKRKYTKGGTEILSPAEFAETMKNIDPDIFKLPPKVEWYDHSKYLEQQRKGIVERVIEAITPPPPEKPTPRAETKTPSKLKSILRRLKGDG